MLIPLSLKEQREKISKMNISFKKNVEGNWEPEENDLWRSVQVQVYLILIFSFSKIYSQVQSLAFTSFTPGIWREPDSPPPSTHNDTGVPGKQQQCFVHLSAEWHPWAGAHAYLAVHPIVLHVPGFHPGQLHNPFHH